MQGPATCDVFRLRDTLRVFKAAVTQPGGQDIHVAPSIRFGELAGVFDSWAFAMHSNTAKAQPTKLRYGR